MRSEWIIILLCTTTMVAGIDTIKRSPGSSAFADLSVDEMNAVIDYLHRQTELNLVQFDKAKMRDASIFLIEAFRPNKADVLNYLDNGEAAPQRAARAIILRGDLPVPVIEEYKVFPVPNPSRLEPIRNPIWRNPIPFNARSPKNKPEQELLLKVFTDVLTPVNDILVHMTGGWGYVNCSDRCLTDVHSLPPVTDAGHHKMLVYLCRDIEGVDLHPIGLQFLLNMDDINPQNWFVEYVWLQGHAFSNFHEVREAHNQKRLNLFNIPEPDNFKTKELRSSLNFRGDPRPIEAKRGPWTSMPDGDRVAVTDRHIYWMGWEFEFGFLASSGIQLFDITFLKERVAYEISFQEAGVFYSGGNPAARHTHYFDSFTVFGHRVSELFNGIDCPKYAEFFNFVIFENGAARTYKNAACVFEHNRGIPLRRHYQGASDEGDGDRFAQGIPDNVLIFRQILTVENYDYIIDFMFHQAGQIEGKVSLSGYPLSTFYTGPEMDKYGHVINDPRALGMIHDHFLNFRVDLDILGTANRFETLDIKLENITNDINTDKTMLNKYFDHNLRRTELEAAYMFNFSTPKYLIIYNNKEKNRFGYPRGYRIMSEGMSKLLLPQDYPGYRARAWTQYQLAVTKYKDNERWSSSSYAQMEMFDPVFSFQDYIDDNDDIVDQDLVVWITLGAQHIPHSEDVPVVNTVGVQFTFYLLPYNYFNDDPSLASRDNIRVSLSDDGNKYHYSGVPSGNVPTTTTTKEPCVNVVAGNSGVSIFPISISVLIFSLVILYFQV